VVPEKVMMRLTDVRGTPLTRHIDAAAGTRPVDVFITPATAKAALDNVVNVGKVGEAKGFQRQGNRIILFGAAETKPSPIAVAVVKPAVITGSVRLAKPIRTESAVFALNSAKLGKTLTPTSQTTMDVVRGLHPPLPMMSPQPQPGGIASASMLMNPQPGFAVLNNSTFMKMQMPSANFPSAPAALMAPMPAPGGGVSQDAASSPSPSPGGVGSPGPALTEIEMSRDPSGDAIPLRVAEVDPGDVVYRSMTETGDADQPEGDTLRFEWLNAGTAKHADLGRSSANTGAASNVFSQSDRAGTRKARTDGMTTGASASAPK
jgi:hypothetical protein